MKKNSKIAIVAGGTGGHIFPAISLLEQLIVEKKKVIFFGCTRFALIFFLFRVGRSDFQA